MNASQYAERRSDEDAAAIFKARRLEALQQLGDERRELNEKLRASFYVMGMGTLEKARDRVATRQRLREIEAEEAELLRALDQ